ncbi:MAG TPA: fused MFS/spermidine synthase [Thermoanaerobaculia bacterium]|nr:fused MFS/spermidine synthase [Thermoanaerobaculia bacterium]
MLPRLRFYWVVVTCGAVIMALEIVSSRILAPYFGNSVYIWGSIISVFLAALSLGYLWGGRLADRHPTMAALGRMITFAAFGQALLLMAGVPVTQWLAARTGGASAGPLLAATVLFGPTSVLLATVSPWAVRLAARDLGHLGNTAGRLYALSTLGSLAGTLACTFLLIPFLELREILGLLTALTAVTALVAFGERLRAEAPTAALAALLVVFAVARGASVARPAPGLLHERTTPYQTLRVYERDGVRRLESDRMQQSAVEMATGEPAVQYIRHVPFVLLLRPDMDRMLALGMGAGSAAGYLQKRLPGLEMDNVDIDPAVPELARRFLLFRDSPRNRVHVADGRSFVHASDERWDFIFSDTYIGGSVPFHMTTVQFLEEVKRRLEPGGVFGVNLAAGLADPFSQAIYHTVEQRFRTTYVIQVKARANVLVLATDADPLPSDRLLARARELDRRWRFEPTLESLAGSRAPVDLDASGVPVLTDEFAPVDRLIRLGQAARDWDRQQ